MSGTDQPEPTPEPECVRCRAGATVGRMILQMASWLRVLHRGDGRPPAPLMAALYAEDWAQVKQEWDTWVWPQLKDEHYQAISWLTTADTMLQTTSEALKELGGSGPPTDLVKAREAGEARE